MTGNVEQAGEAPGKGGMEIERMAVKISHLDTLLGLTGEIIIAASNISILQRHLNTSAQNVDKDTMEMVKLATMTTGRISSDLHHLVMDIRMVPINETFLRFRRLVRDTAKKRGKQVNFEIVGEAKNGVQALEILDRGLTDIVFLDVMMPEMDGLEALTNIKETRPEIVVIMITGNPSKENVEESIRGGASGFIVKPFNSAKVIDTLNRAWQSRRTK